MAATKSRARTARPAGLPPVTVARFEEAASLVERMLEENTSVFLQAGQRYRDKHRTAASRPLTAEESAQVASAMAAVVNEHATVEDVQRIQDSSLRAYEEPAAQEVLLAAGLATAPMFMEVVRTFVALIELPANVFEDACETETLEETVDGAAAELRRLPMPDARRRAGAALEHYASAAGYDPGKGWALLVDTVREAFTNAAQMMTPDRSPLASLIDSAASTAASPDEMSSTA